MIKISKVGEDLYQINNQEIPIDRQSAIELVASTGNSGEVVMNHVDVTGFHELLEVTSNTGTVVNIYEVDYPQPKDPNKETQEMSRSVDEYNDFVTQNLFPGVSAEDIVVEMRQPDPKEHPQFVPKKRSSWRRLIG